MYKHIAYLIILTVIIILTMNYCHLGLHYLFLAHGWIVAMLGKVIAGGKLGMVIKALLAALIIPLVIGGIVGLIYWLFKKGQMPYILTVIWSIWLILMTTIVIKH